MRDTRGQSLLKFIDQKMRSSQICVKCHLAILIMSLDQPVSCWREVLLSSLMISGNVRTESQKLQPNQNIVRVN